MNALQGCSVAAAVIYGLFVDGTYFKIFLAIVAIYTLVTQVLLKKPKDITKRKNIMVASWGGKLAILQDNFL
jgi:hypothetical protein